MGMPGRWFTVIALVGGLLVGCGTVTGGPAASAPPSASGRVKPATGASLAQEVAQASDSSLPVVVATVNGAPLHRRVVAQAEVLLSHQRSYHQKPPTKSQLESAALYMTIQQVVLNQVAKRRGLDPTVTQAIQAYKHDAQSEPSFLAAVKSTGSTASHPSAAWIQGYQESTGSSRLIRQAVGNQGSQAQQRFIRRLVSQARVVVSADVPSPRPIPSAPRTLPPGASKPNRTGSAGCPPVSFVLPATTSSGPCGMVRQN